MKSTWEPTKGSLIKDLRFFDWLLAVFLVLTVLDRVINFVKSKTGDDH